MKKLLYAVGLLTLTLQANSVFAFCGFYVSKADTKLYNQASQVVLVRDGDRTVITMGNDFQGDVKDFAMVIPVPTLLEEDQINIADQSLIDHLDAYTAPRLVEYYDENPCMRRKMLRMEMAQSSVADSMPMMQEESGVTIEASYTVGEYDILILAAEQSDGLISWLKTNDYRLPEGAEQVVGSYLKQDMRFFVARVNLKKQESLGFSTLRPLQIAFESPRFMLPIRLGTLNADGKQELFVYTLTRTGRVETSNYRTVRLPTDIDIPVGVKDHFGEFYKDLFTYQVDKNDGRAVFLEYAWDMAWCDPCAADPLSAHQLNQLGVYWLNGESVRSGSVPDVFVTRLHVRYDAEHFPDDLRFIETGDRTNFQGRYVMRHAWEGQGQCAEADVYRKRVKIREAEAVTRLASLTGWDDEKISALIGSEVQVKDKWWKRIGQ